MSVQLGGGVGTSILPLEVQIFQWSCIKLKWYSSYLLNTSLKGLDHFILIRIMTLLEIVYTNTRIDKYVYSYNDIIGDR